MSTYRVWSEREPGSWTDCVYAAGLTMLAIAGWTRFPLGAYTDAEREALESSDDRTDETGATLANLAQAIARRYGPGATMHAATDLRALLGTPGLVIGVIGLNARLVTRLRHWDPTFAGNHMAAVVTLGPAGLLWLDPEAPMGYQGEPISVTELLTWWNKGEVRYLGVGELTVTTITLTPFAPTRRASFAGGRTFFGYNATTLAQSKKVTTAAAGSAAACKGSASIAPAPAWAPDGKVWLIADGALAGCYVAQAGITVAAAPPPPPPDCSAAVAARDAAWRTALDTLTP